MKSNTNQNIIVYARVSTEDQKDNFSLESQIEHAILYAKNQKLIGPDEDIPKENIFEEEHSASYTIDDTTSFDFSTYLPKRPILRALLEFAHEKKFTDFIVYSRDRLTRNVKEFVALIARFHMLGIKVHYCKPGEYNKPDTSDDWKAKKITQLIDIVLASVAEYEANTISDRVKNGCKQCVKNGYWPGGIPPYGYDIAEKENKKKNKKLKLDENTAKQLKVKEVFDYYNYYRYSYQEIADNMQTSYPHENWTKSKVEYIIKNQTYTGAITWNRRGGKRNPGKHTEHIHSKPIEDIRMISDELWKKSVHLRNKLNQNKDSKYYNTPYLLKDKLICGICGEKLKTKNYGKNKRTVYRCPTLTDECISELIIDKESIENTFIMELKNALTSGNYDILWNKHTDFGESKKQDLEDIKNDIKKEIDKIDELTIKIEDMVPFITDTDIAHELLETKSRFIIQRKSLEKQRTNLSKISIDTYATLEEFANAVRKVLNRFSNYDEKINRIFVDLLVDGVIVHKNTNKINIEICLYPPRF